MVYLAKIIQEFTDISKNDLIKLKEMPLALDHAHWNLEAN